MDSRRAWIIRALVAATLVLLFLSLWYYQQQEHVAISSSLYDPVMAYFFNSLSIYKSVPYYYVDHPGTTVELIGTLLIAFTRPMAHQAGVNPVRFILERPWLFTSIAHLFLTISSSVTLALLCLFSVPGRRWTDILFSAAIAVSFFIFLPYSAFRTLVSWTHNSFNFPFGTLLVFFLFIRLRWSTDLQSRDIVVFGLAAGVLSATQLYFAAWIIGTMIALGTYSFIRDRKFLRSILAMLGSAFFSLGGFVIATVPIMHRYREFYWWVKSLILRQGIYGAGAGGVTSLSQIQDNLTWLWGGFQIFFISLAFVYSLFLYSKYTKRTHLRIDAGWWAMAFAIGIQSVVLLLLITKHPGGAYLLSLSALVPIILALIYSALKKVGRSHQTALIILSAVILVSFGKSFIRHRDLLRDISENIDAMMSEYERIRVEYSKDSGKNIDELITVWGYQTASPCYGLRFGNIYTNGAFKSEIDEICPRDWIYIEYDYRLDGADGRYHLDENKDWDILVLMARKQGEVVDDDYGKIIKSDLDDIIYVLSYQ